MFWKKSKDKQSPSQQNKSKTTTTIYRADGGVTSTGSAITAYESKVKSSAKASSSKTTFTISTKQTVTQKQNFSQVTKTYTQFGSAAADSSKWSSSSSTVNLSQKAILPRQYTEPTIVRGLDTTLFNSKYESPYRKGILPVIGTPALPASKTTTTTYQSPYRNTNETSSMREKKTTTAIAPSRTVAATATTLLAAAPKTKPTTVWNPLSSVETTRPLNTSNWNNVSYLPAKASKPPVQTSVIRSEIPPVKPPPPPPAVVQSTRKKKQSPGVVYIFHNDKFDSSDKEFRIGSAEDVRLLKKTFQGFKMQVNLYENLTVREVDNVVRKIEIKDFGSSSCIVVVILTHGTRYETVAAKDGSYSIDDNVLFPILRNRTLRSKPKLLFIQACKGSMESGKFHKDAIQPNGAPDEILKCYSTFEGYVAYRTERGSLFIQSLCELLQEYGKSKNIKDIMDMVIKRVKEKSESHQIPSYETTLTESYMFGDYV